MNHPNSARSASQILLLATLLFASGCERGGNAAPLAKAVAQNTPPGAKSATAVGPGKTASVAVNSASTRQAQPRALSIGPYAVPVADKGIYPDLDKEVRLSFGEWLEQGPVETVRNGTSKFLMVAGVLVSFDVREGESEIGEITGQDEDGDGIPNAIDILIGAKKAVLAKAPYIETYRQIPYPNGDMPRNEGVCTDVVVRALRNAGFDLQKLVHEDAVGSPRDYPGIRKLDANIDHRRVRNLLPYFRRHWKSLPPASRDKSVPWLPGDIVLLNTMNDAQPEHLGVVSDHLGPSGLPLVINSWTYGYFTSEMDLLDSVPVTHRFRSPDRLRILQPEQRGLEGILRRNGIIIEEKHRQVVLVTTPMWDSSLGELRRYERGENGKARAVDGLIAVRVGATGLGRGLGIAQAQAGRLAPAEKTEGDKRSPSGVFLLGTAFGPPSATVAGSKWPWRTTTDADRWVDDPGSVVYNTWQKHDANGGYRSAEELADYSLGLVVRHNDSPVRPGKGSAIFLHPWASAERATTGCTAMDKEQLAKLLSWLDPRMEPVLVQVAGWVAD